VGAKLFRTDTDRQTDMTKLTVAFHNFVNAPNKGPPTRQEVSIFWVSETAYQRYRTTRQ